MILKWYINSSFVLESQSVCSICSHFVVFAYDLHFRIHLWETLLFYSNAVSSFGLRVRDTQKEYKSSHYCKILLFSLVFWLITFVFIGIFWKNCTCSCFSLFFSFKMKHDFRLLDSEMTHGPPEMNGNGEHPLLLRGQGLGFPRGDTEHGMRHEESKSSYGYSSLLLQHTS